jgi:Protein of unknown function (DUF551)
MTRDDWIACSERLPDRRGHYLVYDPDNDPAVTLGYLVSLDWWLGPGRDGMERIDPTHWMPLPPPPGPFVR